MAQIDVIVPVYKVEAYLHQCVDSILMQTYTDWHLILVDDGSPDSCGEICDEYAKKDRRITVIHKENGGLSSARNAGLDIATADYICFIDSDDYVHPEMLEKLYERVTECDADIGICNICRVDETGKAIDSMNNNTPFVEEIWPGIKAFEKVYQPYGYYYIVVWNKIYRREIFRDIRFPLQKLHEDEAVFHQMFFEAKQVVCIQDKCYYYRQRGGSLVTVQNIKDKIDLIEALWQRNEFSERNDFKVLGDGTKASLWYVTMSLDEVSNVDKQMVNLNRKKLRALIPWLLRTSRYSFAKKVQKLLWLTFGVMINRKTIRNVLSGMK